MGTREELEQAVHHLEGQRQMLGFLKMMLQPEQKRFEPILKEKIEMVIAHLENDPSRPPFEAVSDLIDLAKELKYL